MPDDLKYLQQAKAHADEGTFSNMNAVHFLGMAESATVRCRRLAQALYLHVSEAELRKSLPAEDAEYVLSRKGGPVEYEPQ